jgi:hypothetical protein
MPEISEANPRAESESVGNGFVLGPGVERGALAESYERHPDDPFYRPLKIYTIDPSSRRLEGATTVVNVPYEPLGRGPAGSRFKVESTKDGPFGDYGEIDLDDKRILLRNGRDPAPSDPTFHHQMVYAVCSSVYSAFRLALGREIAWGFDSQVLRIRPHAMEGRGAHYSREKKALEFGWFNSALPQAGRVFTCLSHDIVAHEVTHALLDGLRARFEHPVSSDVVAFHEAFADLVAIFQRFSHKEVVKTAIRQTGGDIGRDNLLYKIALEFARGLAEDEAHIRVDGALRRVDLTPSPTVYDANVEPHELGSVLVSAIFDAFATVYRRKVAPYIRLATGGTGLITSGAELSSDLLEILGNIASRLASHFLSICIRAIDYCPPVDITFGEYLRALITADYDLVPDDPWAYREALIEAFGRRHIYPAEVLSLTEDSLLWRPAPPIKGKSKLDLGSLKFSGDPASHASKQELRRQANLLGSLVTASGNLRLFGCTTPDDPEVKHDKLSLPVIESVRSSRRVGRLDGRYAFDLVAEVIQLRTIPGGKGYPDFDFYGGATVIIGPKGELRYVIDKKITNSEKAARQREYYMNSKYSSVWALHRCLLGKKF